MVSLIEIIIAAIVGGVASLIAPWANWGVEKKKKKLMWRKVFVDHCKNIVNKHNFNPDRFRETSYYSNLKPHLSKKLRKEVEEKRYVPGSIMSREEMGRVKMKEFAVKKKLLDEITILEKKWGLI